MKVTGFSFRDSNLLLVAMDGDDSSRIRRHRYARRDGAREEIEYDRAFIGQRLHKASLELPSKRGWLRPFSTLSRTSLGDRDERAIPAHRRPEIEATYNHHDCAAEKPESLELLAAHIQDVVEQPPSDVVRFGDCCGV